MFQAMVFGRKLELRVIALRMAGPHIHVMKLEQSERLVDDAIKICRNVMVLTGMIFF